MKAKDIGAPLLVVVLVAFVAVAPEMIPAEVAKPAPSTAPPAPIPASQSLSPNEAIVDVDAVQPAAGKEPVAEAPVPPPRPRIRVESRRLSNDERIQQSVVSALAAAPNISGCIDVETRDSGVRLSGWTMTAGQSLRAEKAAARVKGVRYVVNDIRPRIGAVKS